MYYEEEFDFNSPVVPDYMEAIENIINKEIDTRVDNIKTTNLRLEEKNSELYKSIREIEKENKRLLEDMDNIKETHKSVLNIQNMVNDDNVEKLIDAIGLKKTDIGYGMQEKDIYYRLVLFYYDDKDKLFDILDSFNLKYNKNLRNLRLARDYEKDELLVLLKDLQNRIVCTNSEYIRNNFQYMSIFSRDFVMLPIEKQKVPLQEIFKNKYILDNDCFSFLLDNLKGSSYSRLSYIYQLPSFIKVPKKQMRLLAKTLDVDYIKKKLYDNEKNFINKNFNLFYNDKKWLEFAYTKVSNNKYNCFHYGKFPEEYIIKYLKQFEFKKIIEMVKSDDIDESILKKLIS